MVLLALVVVAMALLGLDIQGLGGLKGLGHVLRLGDLLGRA